MGRGTIEVGSRSEIERPARTRNRVWTFSGATPEGATVAALIELWDAPPAWFDGIPEDDLQDAIRDALARGFVEGLAQAAASPGERLTHALVGGEASLRRLAATKALLYAGSGAEAVAVVVEPGRATVAWVGMVRAYLAREPGGIEQVTTDHSLADAYRREGKSEAEVAEVPANVVVRVLHEGEGPAAQVETREVRWTGPATLVLTSHPVEEVLDPGRIRAAAREGRSAQEVADRLAGEASKGARGRPLGVVVVRARP